MSFCVNDYFNDIWSDMKKADKNVFRVALLQDYWLLQPASLKGPMHIMPRTSRTLNCNHAHTIPKKRQRLNPLQSPKSPKIFLNSPALSYLSPWPTKCSQASPSPPFNFIPISVVISPYSYHPCFTLEAQPRHIPDIVSTLHHSSTSQSQAWAAYPGRSSKMSLLG